MTTNCVDVHYPQASQHNACRQKTQGSKPSSSMEYVKEFVEIESTPNSFDPE